MPNLIPIDINTLPVSMRARMLAGSVNTNFSGGIIDSFPMLSIRGKAFFVRMGGQDYPYIDPSTGLQMNALPVVLVNASKALSKSYYANPYSPASTMNQPDCWSLDSVRPDASIMNPVNATCVDCPMNKFDSADRRDPNKKSGKACQDYRRVAVVLPHQLADAEPQMLLLRVPATSLKNLKAYTDHLERFAVDANAVVTRLSFEQAEWPKLQFDYTGPLTEEQYQRVVQLSSSATVQSMLRSPDFSGALSPSQSQPIAIAGPVIGATPAPVEEVDEETGEITQVQPSLSQPVQQSPMPQLQVVPSNLIELPDGQLYDPIAKVYVERPQPKVEMAELDPDVIDLPDGKFYNQRTKQYVEGPQKHAKELTAESPTKPISRKRAAAKQSEAPAHKQPVTPAPAPVVSATPAPVTAEAPKPEVRPEPVKAEAPNGGTLPKPVVQAAPKAMEAFLSKLMIPSEK
jgi:hypothetical protein